VLAFHPYNSFCFLSAPSSIVTAVIAVIVDSMSCHADVSDSMTALSVHGSAVMHCQQCITELLSLLSAVTAAQSQSVTARVTCLSV
jgi:hypothetical protein